MKQATDLDRLIGLKVRHHRLRTGISQDCLANHLGITFQQVQKYERGENRISAGRLFEIAVYLQTDLSGFFDGLPKGSLPSQQQFPI